MRRAPDGTILIYMIKYEGGHMPDLLSDLCLIYTRMWA